MQTTNARRLRIMVASRAGRLRCVSAVNKVMLQPKQALLLFSAQAHRSTEGPLPPTFLVHYCPSTVLLPYCPTTLLHYCPTTRLRARVYILTIIVSLFLFIILRASDTRRCLFIITLLSYYFIYHITRFRHQEVLVQHAGSSMFGATVRCCCSNEFRCCSVVRVRTLQHCSLLNDNLHTSMSGHQVSVAEIGQTLS